ncbi:bifunctional lysylphosphatidylglycerol flippase/synthetase MprF [Frigoribacterium sp. 2-23]|uniref:bifunctional lysylphosphatidylglycerol flippase/synthetase MprF n=1 Tax=Frigoribacterium sp. 2-23 TaxID=3415006 RepID=UPI003C6EDB53
MNTLPTPDGTTERTAERATERTTSAHDANRAARIPDMPSAPGTGTSRAATPWRAVAASSRALGRFPIAALSVALGAAWLVTPSAMPPHTPFVAVLIVALTALALGWAEARVGSVRTGAVAALGSTAAAALAFVFIKVGADAGEVFSQMAALDRVWAPSVTAVVVVAAVSRSMAPYKREGVRAALTTVVLAGVLFGGHGLDVARALGLVIGLLAGRLLVAPSPAPAWRDQTNHRARSVVAVFMATLALGWSIALVSPVAVGVLAPLGAVFDPQVTIVAIAALVLATGLLLRGRRLGLVISVAALLLMTGLLAWYFTVLPLTEQWFTWQGIDVGEAEWQVLLLLLWVAPAATLGVLLSRRAAFARRRAASWDAAHHDRVFERVVAGDAGTLGYMATWLGNSHWFAPTSEASATPDHEGAVAYRVAHGVALTVSDPLSTADDAPETIRRFARHCSAAGLIPAFYSIHGRHLDTFAELGWSVTPVAEEAVLDLATFSTAGKKRQDLRTATNRALRDGVSAHWGSYDTLPRELRRQVEALNTEWVGAKALPEMGFTLGSLRELQDANVRLLLAVDEHDRVHGITSWLPVHRHGVLVGYTLDVMRRGVDPMPGVMEYLISTAALTFKADGLEVLSLSGTPLACAHTDAPTRIVDRVIAHALAVTGRALEPSYGFTSLMRFKAKFDPRYETLWVAYPSPTDLAPIGRALTKAYVPSLRAQHVVAAVRAARLHSRRAAGAGTGRPADGRATTARS